MAESQWQLYGHKNRQRLNDGQHNISRCHYNIIYITLRKLHLFPSKLPLSEADSKMRKNWQQWQWILPNIKMVENRKKIKINLRKLLPCRHWNMELENCDGLCRRCFEDQHFHMLLSMIPYCWQIRKTFTWKYGYFDTGTADISASR